MTNASNKCVNYLRNIRDEQACLCMSCKWLLWASGRLLCFDSIQKLDFYDWMALYNVLILQMFEHLHCWEFGSI